ncbi:hypothetical protein [Thiohalocapsa marina]|uniref:hypothetical protein n=1 Tax=Thiohalocapsa marina TaxID=424902 RepID=UPI0036DD3A6E
MPGNSKPRKAYRPRPIGRPVLDRMRNDLILPAYSALETLRTGTDPDALESARHTLAALLDYLWVALTRSGRDVATTEAGLEALRGLIARHQRTGAWRCTGSELAALRASVIEADQVLPLLRTDQLTAAMVAVLAAMDRMAFHVETRP